MPPRSAKKPIVYETRILAYLDILGWKDQVERSSKALRDGRRRRSHETSEGGGERHSRIQTGDGEKIPRGADGTGRDGLLGHGRALVRADRVVGPGTRHPGSTILPAPLMALGLYVRGAIVRGLLHHRDNVILWSCPQRGA